MKLSSMMRTSFVAVAVFVVTADCAFAAAKVVSHSNQNNNKLGLTCPTGETATTNPTTGKQECVRPTATPLNNRQNLNGENESPMPQDRGTAPAPNSAPSHQTDDRGPFTLTAPAGTPTPAKGPH